MLKNKTGCESLVPITTNNPTGDLNSASSAVLDGTTYYITVSTSTGSSTTTNTTTCNPPSYYYIPAGTTIAATGIPVTFCANGVMFHAKKNILRSLSSDEEDDSGPMLYDSTGQASIPLRVLDCQTLSCMIDILSDSINRARRPGIESLNTAFAALVDGPDINEDSARFIAKIVLRLESFPNSAPSEMYSKDEEGKIVSVFLKARAYLELLLEDKIS